MENSDKAQNNNTGFKTDDKPRNADEYIAVLRSQIEQNTECGTTYYNLAVALLGKQEYEEAEEALHNAVECTPNLAEAYVLLGGLCLRNNDLDGCLKYNKIAVKSRAGFAEGYGNIGFVLLQQCTGEDPEADINRLEEAIKNLQKAVVFNPKFVQAFTTLGTAYFMKGLIDEGIAANLKAVSIEPNFPIAHNNLAVAYLEKGEYDKSIKHCDIAEELGFDVLDQLKKELEPHRKTK